MHKNLWHGKNLVFLGGIFLLSVLVRLPHFDRPLSKHHEFNAAMVLVGCEAWKAAGGPAVFHGAPMASYPHPGDYYYVTHPQVKDGKLYYLSFGPGQFLLPYLVAATLGVEVSPLLLQILNLLAHALAAWFLYRLAMLFSVKEEQRATIVLAAVLFFLFSAAPLWFFGNGYVHESLVMPFFTGAVFYGFQFFRDPATITTGRLTAFSLLIALGIYFDWLQLFTGGFIALASFIKSIKRQKKYGPLFITTACAVALPLVLILWQYGSHFGYAGFFDLLMNKFSSRQGLQEESSFSFWRLLQQIAKHFITGYGPLLGLPILYFFVRGRMDAGVKKELQLLSWFCLPVGLYFLVFASFSAEHDYSVLKFAPFIALTAALVLTALFPAIKKALASAFVLAMISVAMYFYINRPGATSRNGDPYDKEMRMGRFMAKTASPDQLVLFGMKDANWLALMYYSKRNILYQPSPEAALDYLKSTPAPGAVFFTWHNGMIKAQHLTR